MTHEQKITEAAMQQTNAEQKLVKEVIDKVFEKAKNIFDAYLICDPNANKETMDKFSKWYNSFDEEVQPTVDAIIEAIEGHENYPDCLLELKERMIDRKPVEERELLNGKYFTLDKQRAYLDGVAEGYEKGRKESKDKLDLAESDIKLFLERIHYLEKACRKLRDNISELADYAEINVNEEGEPIC